MSKTISASFLKKKYLTFLSSQEVQTEPFYDKLGQLKNNLTSSNYPTYITEIGLYDDQNSLIGYAKLSKPIPKSQKILTKFLLRMDY